MSREHRQLIFDSTIYCGERDIVARQILARMAELAASEEPTKPRNPQYETYIGWCWVSQATLAREIGCPIRRIERNVKRIREDGWFAEERTYRDKEGHKHTEYRLDFEKIEGEIPTVVSEEPTVINVENLPSLNEKPTVVKCDPYRRETQSLPSPVTDKRIAKRIEKRIQSNVAAASVAAAAAAAAASTSDGKVPLSQEGKSTPKLSALSLEEWNEPAFGYEGHLIRQYALHHRDHRCDKFLQKVSVASLHNERFVHNLMMNRPCRPPSDTRAGEEYRDTTKYSTLMCGECKCAIPSDWPHVRCQACLDKFDEENKDEMS